MKIYTKTGDSGTTSLFGGKRVNKDNVRIEAYGSVDELNSLLGVIISEANNAWVIKKLIRVQSELMVIGANLATPSTVKLKIPQVKKSFVNTLEREIDSWDRKLPLLKNFVLPGGSFTASKIHLARSVARRCERSTIKLNSLEKINKNTLMYLNRLSDWLFVLARYINKEESGNEIIWKGRSKS